MINIETVSPTAVAIVVPIYASTPSLFNNKTRGMSRRILIINLPFNKVFIYIKSNSEYKNIRF